MKIRNVILSKWFPANDTFATKMARICILREELMFELQCSIEAVEMKNPKEYDNDWRSLYFFRKMHITVTELRSAIERLSMDEPFQAFLNEHPNTFRREFDVLKNKLNSTFKGIKGLRSDVGAHILEQPVHQALQNMSSERRGFFQLSSIYPRKTHYEFTSELIMAIILRDSNDEERKAKSIIEALMSTFDKLFERIDRLFVAYLKHRRLI